jgi:PadR family transcriptional regulator PadR
MAPSFRISAQTLRVLEALLEDRRGWHYGYSLSQQTELMSGTLYPILQRLEAEGWLETKWAESEQPGRPPRHLYRMTEIGVREARKLIVAAPGPRQAPRLRGAVS